MCDLRKKNKKRNICESHGSENSNPLKPCPLPSCHTHGTCMLKHQITMEKVETQALPKGEFLGKSKGNRGKEKWVIEEFENSGTKS